jgi:outer membrane receptor protein involved in Fe transport
MRSCLGALGLLVLLPVALAAQEGLRITVVDATTARPLVGATVEVLGVAGTVLRTATTDRRGQADARRLDAGEVTVSARLVGYQPQTMSVSLSAEGTQDVTVRLVRAALVLDPVVVTARRTEEVLLEVPVAVSVVEAERLEQQTALTTIEYLSTLPESQVLSGGLMTRRYTTRGPNFGNSATVRTMTDFRYTTLPGIAANADYLVSTNVEDIARAELIRGQGTVQYGPNSSRGVLNLITRSPLDDRGTIIAVAGGERSTVQATFRHATAVSEKVGVKLSGEYFEGKDWLPPDVDPDAMIGGNRLDASQRIRGDARVDWRPDDKTSAMFNAGVGQGTVFDAVTFAGNRAYLNDARMWYLQGRMTRGDLSANVFYNQLAIDEGEFVDLSVPSSIKESSYNFWAQLQHGTRVGSRTRLQYGADLGRTVPQSDSTLYGSFEGQADLTEVGAFLSATARLSPKFEVVLAGRLDYHSIIGNTAFSPWATVVYNPTPSHAIRFGASRSFTPPTPIGMFADFPIAAVGPYDLRFTGGGPGRTFRRDCAGLCMRSPFNTGGASEYLPADATTQWGAVVAILQGQGIDISGVPAPDGSQVASLLATLNTSTGSFDPTTASDVIDVQGVHGNDEARRWITQLELGYKGLINNRIRIGVDVYYRENSHIAGQNQVVTPNVFFDQASLESYLAQFMSAGQAAQIAGAVAGIPMGTVTPEQATNPTDLQLGQFRVPGINYWGAALDLEVAITPELSARGAYTYISEDLIVGQQNARVVFNNPKNQIVLGVGYVNPRIGFNATLQGRHLQSYPGANGSFQAQMPGYTLVDVVVGYRIPRTNIALSVTAYNVFDDVHQELPGAAAIGRLVIGGVRAVF